MQVSLKPVAFLEYQQFQEFEKKPLKVLVQQLALLYTPLVLHAHNQ